MSAQAKGKPNVKDEDAAGRNAASTELALDDDEVFRIINQTDLMSGPAASLGAIPGSTAYKIVRPSELDAMQAREQQRHPVDRSASAGVKAMAQQARKPLVELIDGDEMDDDKSQDQEGAEGQGQGQDQGEEEEDDDDDDEPPIGEFGEEMFRLALNLIVFGTLWLCLWV